MINLDLQIPAIEKLIKLMKKYGLDEISCDFINIKKSQEVKKQRKPYTRKPTKEQQEKAILDKHTEPHPISTDEPWNNIPQSSIDEYIMTGKVK